MAPTPSQHSLPKPSPRKPVGIRDIAAEAGCSIAAVSKVLNGAQGSTSVGPALTQRIQSIATRLGYQPNSSAQSLRANRPIGIGVLLPAEGGGRSPIAGGFHSQLVSGMELATHEAGQSLILIGEPTGPAFGERALRYLAQRRINGLVLLPNDNASFIQRMAAAPGPVVWAACPWERSQPRVIIDPAPGVIAALEHLVSLGHRRILVLTREGESLRHRCRIAREWLVAQGLSAEVVDVGSSPVNSHGHATWTMEVPQARAAMADYFARKGTATAVLCLTELIAHGAYYGIFSAGLSIPRDISLVSFDYIRPHLFDPIVTSISHELPVIGHAAAQLAIARAAEPSSEPTVLSIPSRLIVGASTGPVRSST